MQAQIARTEQNQVFISHFDCECSANSWEGCITSQQSLQSIQTLLKAGLGCITYLRYSSIYALRRICFPQTTSLKFVLTCHYPATTSSSPESLSSQPSQSDGSFGSNDGRRNVSGFKIMTVTRGFTEEADKLLDFLENGIFDALQKQYLRSFVFAIYLYCKVSGTDTVIPVMTLGEDLMKLSLSGARKPNNLLSNATKGKCLLSERLSEFASLDHGRRLDSNQESHPSHNADGRVADVDLLHSSFSTVITLQTITSRLIFVRAMWRGISGSLPTHDEEEVPEKCSIGSIQTGYHGVGVQVTSVAGYLPSAEDNNAPFLGTTNGNSHQAPTLTPAEEATMRAQQVEAQLQDAIERRVVWDADNVLGDEDADGDDDTDLADLGSWRVKNSVLEYVAPIGIRDDAGNIVPLLREQQQQQQQQQKVDKHHNDLEALYAGTHESVPTRIAQLPKERVAQTQQLEYTQVIDSPIPTPSRSSSPPHTPTPKRQSAHLGSAQQSIGCTLPPSDLDPQSFASVSDVSQIQTIDTQFVKDIIMNGAATLDEDTEMLGWCNVLFLTGPVLTDMETQITPGNSNAESSIQSFSTIKGRTDITMPVMPPEMPIERKKDAKDGDDNLECDCGVLVEDCDLCMCESGCEKWFHLWCMGYHSTSDKRIPDVFACFDCRVKADQNWDLIVVHDLYPRMIARFRDLAILRRAIKLFETHNPDSLSAFTKLIGCDTTVAGQLFKRLEIEVSAYRRSGFIALEIQETDDTGILETTTTRSHRRKTGKNSKARGSQRRKNIQKPKYVFVRASVNGKLYQDYFNPDPEVEKTLLGLSDLFTNGLQHRRNVIEPISLLGVQATSRLDAEHNDVDYAPGTQAESQTQEDPQTMQLAACHDTLRSADFGLKRKACGTSEQDMTKTGKKIKISIGPAVDLGD
ncbi:hypothetical protein A0H81_14343, partial [Grifola frondosa]